MTVEIRRSTDADLLAIADVRVRSWQAAYRGLVPASHLDAMDPAAIAARWRDREVPGDQSDVVLTVSDRVVGWAATGPYRGDDAPTPGCGEVMAIYLHPDFWARGLGRGLMDHALGSLADARLAPVLLWVLEGNERARRFYARAGFRPDGGRQPYRTAGAEVPEIRYRHDGLAPAP